MVLQGAAPFLICLKNDQGSQQHDSAFVSELEDYKGPRRPSWLAQADSKMIYKRKKNRQVLYVVPINSILSELPAVPVGPGDKGTFPFSMGAEAAEFLGASCDSRPGAGDGCRLWYVNAWAMAWSAQM